MAEVRWSPQAADDLDAIAEFISTDSPHYASLFVTDVLATVERIGLLPRIGRVVPETNDPLIREVVLGSYRIIYRAKGDLVEVLTVYHGARLLDPSQIK